MRHGLRRLTVFALSAMAGTGALAFSFIGSRWAQPTMTFYTGISDSAPSGATWSSALLESMAQWNDRTDFTFVSNPGYASPCGSLDGVNGIDFGNSVCGTSFGTNVLAVTLTLNNGGVFFGFRDLYETNMIFNSSLSWDIYDGARRSRIDFRRVALHEMGHALGLDHENSQPAMMASYVSDLYTLQADDVAGVQALYSGASEACMIRDLSANAGISDRLAAGDCRVYDLFGGTDDSFVDIYRLRLEHTTTLDIAMKSTELDSVLIVANATYGNIEVYDDVDGQCDAHVRKILPAGEYRIMANTYDRPAKCAGNIGGYSLTVTDSNLPVLGAIRNAAGGTSLANALISGGASADGGATYASTFAANQPIDVLARLIPDPLHVGQAGRVYVLARLSDGRQFMKDGNGQFVSFPGTLASLVPMRTGTLSPTESVTVASGLRGAVSGLAGQTISVYVGYALDSAPQQIWYGSNPIRFTISAQ